MGTITLPQERLQRMLEEAERRGKEEATNRSVSEEDKDTEEENKVKEKYAGLLPAYAEVLKIGDNLTLSLDNGSRRRLLVYLGNDEEGKYVFSDGPFKLRYSRDTTNFLLISAEICHGNFIRLQENESRAENLIRDLHRENLREVGWFYESNQANCVSDEISVESVDASDVVREQLSGTCFAHAAATAIRAAESRIIGREPEGHDELLDRIVDKFGSDGGDPREVLRHFCPQKRLGCSKLRGMEDILNSLRNNRVVVFSFGGGTMKKFHWDLFDAFFKQNPSGVLKKEHFCVYDEERLQTFPPELLQDDDAHAVVITGLSEDGPKPIFKVKNSWGDDFADNGYFRMEADAFPTPLYDCVDVYFTVDRLAKRDIRNYLMKGLGSCRDMITVHGNGVYSVQGCTSFLHLVDANKRNGERVPYPQTNGNIAYARDLTRTILGELDGVTITASGRIKVNGSRHSFRISVLRCQPYLNDGQERPRPRIENSYTKGKSYHNDSQLEHETACGERHDGIEIHQQVEMSTLPDVLPHPDPAPTTLLPDVAMSTGAILPHACESIPLYMLPYLHFVPAEARRWIVPWAMGQLNPDRYIPSEMQAWIRTWSATEDLLSPTTTANQRSFSELSDALGNMPTTIRTGTRQATQQDTIGDVDRASQDGQVETMPEVAMSTGAILPHVREATPPYKQRKTCHHNDLQPEHQTSCGEGQNGIKSYQQLETSTLPDVAMPTGAILSLPDPALTTMWESPTTTNQRVLRELSDTLGNMPTTLRTRTRQATRQAIISDADTESQDGQLETPAVPDEVMST